MPSSALTYCAESNCRALVRRGRCEAHKRPAWGGKERAPFNARYSPEYRRNRKAILARDPYCTILIHCSGAPSTEVDHIIPGGGDSPDNLRGACHACNHARGSALGGSRGRAA